MLSSSIKGLMISDDRQASLVSKSTPMTLMEAAKEEQAIKVRAIGIEKYKFFMFSKLHLINISISKQANSPFIPRARKNDYFNLGRYLIIS